MYRILYAGRDKTQFSFLRDSLPHDMKLEPGYEKINLQTAIKAIHPHGIILPIMNPGPEEFTLLKKIISIPQVPGIIVTSVYLTVAQAVSCMRFGVYDCLVGPLTGNIIAACLNRMIHSADIDEVTSGKPFAGNSSAIVELRDRLNKYSDLPYPVLVSGETGSGKELAAKTIHTLSKRCTGPFTAVNCASCTDDLLGSEMFGSLKGAFTGSIDRPGLFEISSGGTLFLDEIGELSLRGQASFLRVIEEGYIRRVGSCITKKINVRIVAATNKDLRECVKRGTFRKDLYYRLNLLGITIPPLRKRKDDIFLLSQEFLRTLSKETLWRIENSALSLLVQYHWPGNVRELHSVLLKASISAKNGRILASDLSFPELHADLAKKHEPDISEEP